jgi:hypothetical protein
LEPFGSHALVDPVMSSSQVRFIHYGAGFDRFEKMAFIAQSDFALRHLHVCFRDKSDKNCGRCEKCYRTLLALELLAAREKATSFPSGCFSLDHLKTLPPDRPTDVRRLRQMKEVALRVSRLDVASAIETCLAAAKAPNHSDHSANRKGWCMARIADTLRSFIR